MASVINRNTLEFRPTAHTPDFVGDPDWVINPDMSGVAGVPQRYWKMVGDVPTEMTQPEKDAVDAAALSALNAQKEDLIKSRIKQDPLAGITVDVSASGLTITTSINSIIVDDQTVIVPDVSETKYVMVSYIHNETTDVLEVVVFERLESTSYGDLAADERLVADLKEFSVVAGGTDLVEV